MRIFLEQVKRIRIHGAFFGFAATLDGLDTVPWTSVSLPGCCKSLFLRSGGVMRKNSPLVSVLA